MLLIHKDVYGPSIQLPEPHQPLPALPSSLAPMQLSLERCFYRRRQVSDAELVLLRGRHDDDLGGHDSTRPDGAEEHV